MGAWMWSEAKMKTTPWFSPSYKTVLREPPLCSWRSAPPSSLAGIIDSDPSACGGFHALPAFSCLNTGSVYSGVGCVAINPLTNCGASEQNRGVFKRNVAGGEGDFKPPPRAFHSRLILPLVPG